MAVCLCLAGACSGSLLEDKEELLHALNATETSAREFTYEETVKGHTRTVTGTFEDDLRYSVLFAEDGLGVIQMVVSDDMLAVKVFDPAKVPALQNPAEDPAMLASLEALRRGEWVIDPAGAPPLETVGVGGGVVEVGADPIVDAINVLQYVRLAIQEAASVQEWQKEDIQAAYRLGEDTFDPSNPAVGVKRFDLVRVAIPRAAGGGAADPRTFNFRKMAIYVQNGHILRVSEEIDWENHIEITRAKREKKPKYLLELLERLRKGETELKIIPRRMDLKLSLKPNSVEIPIGLTSSLAGLFSDVEEEEQTEPQPQDASTPAT